MQLHLQYKPHQIVQINVRADLGNIKHIHKHTAQSSRLPPQNMIIMCLRHQTRQNNELRCGVCLHLQMWVNCRYKRPSSINICMIYYAKGSNFKYSANTYFCADSNIERFKINLLSHTCVALYLYVFRKYTNLYTYSLYVGHLFLAAIFKKKIQLCTCFTL